LIQSDIRFTNVQWTLLWLQINFGAKNEHWLIPHLFLALAFHNELEYRHIYLRVNSGGDASTSCKNLENFGPVSPDMTGLIYFNLYLHWAKIGLPTFICCASICKRVGWFPYSWAH